MSIQVGIERIDGLEEIRDRFGDSGQVERRIGEVLNKAARIGVASARVSAPKDQRRLVAAIREDSIQITTAQGFIEASFGVQPVSRATRGAGGRFTGSTSGALKYPLWVHEGTGLYGHFHRAITPRRRKFMVFVGRTGLVFARSVRGQKPQPYMRHGYEEARAYIDTHLGEMVDRLFD
jgi:hypothetical protein